MTGHEPLPSHLQLMLEFIRKHILDCGYAPSVREICTAADIPSTSTAHARLRQLEDAGFLRRDPSKPRAMVILDSPLKTASGDNIPDDALKGLTGQSEQPFLPSDYLSVPFIPFADIARAFSGDDSPIDHPPGDRPWMIPAGVLKDDSYFITIMPDGGMINRQVNAGDHLIVRRQKTANNNDMIIGRLNGETLIRTYTKGLRQVRLQVEGDDFVVVTIDPEELTIYGVVSAILHLTG